MTKHGKLPRPVPTLRLGVVGHRDLEGVDRAMLTATVTVFLGQLQGAVHRSAATLRKLTPIDPYSTEPPTLLMVNSLAEGSDQLVAETAVDGGHGYGLWCPIPFTVDKYKSYFTHDKERSLATFDRLLADPDAAPSLIELGCSTSEEHRGAGYAAAAVVLLDNSDLLLALHDPSRAGSHGGTAETIAKAIGSGLPVIGVEIPSSEKVEVLSVGAGRKMTGERLTNERLDEIVDHILVGRFTELTSAKRAARRTNRL